MNANGMRTECETNANRIKALFHHKSNTIEISSIKRNSPSSSHRGASRGRSGLEIFPHKILIFGFAADQISPGGFADLPLWRNASPLVEVLISPCGGIGLPRDPFQ